MNAIIEKNIENGAVLTGTISNIVEYGAFVDLGDRVTGLLHVSQLPGNTREERDRYLSQLRVSDEITVQVLDSRTLGGRTRYSLSVVSLVRARHGAKLGQKETHKGTVVRVTEDHYLIDLGQGVSGRLAVDEIRAVLKKGDHVRVKVHVGADGTVTVGREGIDSEKEKARRESKANARREADRQLRSASKGAGGAKPRSTGDSKKKGK